MCFPANSLEIEKLISVLTFFSCSGNQNQKWRMGTPVAGSDLFDDEDSIVVGKFVCIYSPNIFNFPMNYHVRLLVG